MLFLKQIRAHGFKSFAELTVLDFTHEMVGIVGPNGSGKSNITDAIRWALGEQSSKSLRGAGLDDVVFSGSANLPPQETAEVTLVFDNSTNVFQKWATPLVEITRRFNKKTRDSDFYINNERVKLKEIQDLALETGLTKSSIAIISQGTISKFAEAKPDERREIFDEAAGVAKYKRRKREAQTKLIKAMENYHRANDLTLEIEKRLPNLERQAHKARLAEAKKTELQQFEKSILTLDVQSYQKRIGEIMEFLPNIETEVRQLTNDLQQSETELNELLKDNSLSGNTISNLNQDFQKLVEKISDLKIQKTAAEEHENQQKQNNSFANLQADKTQRDFANIKNAQQMETDRIREAKNNFDRLNEQYDAVNNKYQNLRQELEQLQNTEGPLTYRLTQLRNQKVRGFDKSQGYQAIINNQKNLPGVIGSLKDLVSVDEQYQIAISAVIANTLNAIVMRTNADVKASVNFLRTNQLGRVTFLPLDTLTPSTITGSTATMIANQKGFLGFANQIVKIKAEYQIALDYALGTVIVVNEYDDAIQMAQTIQNRFNIVSLTGDRILPRGAIVGGQNKTSNLFQTPRGQESNLVDLENQLANLYEALKIKGQALHETKIARDGLRDEVNECQSRISIGNHQIQQYQKQLQDLNNQYLALTGKSLLGNSSQAQQTLASVRLAKEILKCESQRDDLQNHINKITLAKNKYAERQQELNTANQAKREILNNKRSHLTSAQQELTLIEKDNSAKLAKLQADYGLTLETVLNQKVEGFTDEEKVRERISILIQELRNLGNVNYDSIAEYQTEKERYDYFKQELESLFQGMKNFENIIKSIDQEMETQFKQVVDDVNTVLPEVFQKLFGGGDANLKYTDPDNILETGIEIRVNPPGKKITNINLLSGGEKSLVALSVLFSILKVRPLPLVILDEAEAPLDPANVERFARYVRHFTKDSQFLIVTHREGTMENCDILYGVTMETQGVTKMVKIKLVEAKQLGISEQQVTA
ncbi:chromosome segregation protein [Entomoplasma freundtii]|uniref:Chromosome partition protein Smc n=1 Tax=Entomoplasma freundtii TaxID=74700 RepID=A0A2K8NU17_9MOLU|nr:AAA family ATPase [Entomoplasma freundtii]ATZ16251.1 chromosome condensation and segregation SMC ATPase [Entomoplasma freundtii]TDY56848.1 chromosome segregation protein [Entomoplasma freundtii]